jgi:hypothetical protein
MKRYGLFLILFFFACKNDPPNELEQARQQLEAKKQKLEDKKALASLQSELKNIDQELQRIDGINPQKNNLNGIIKGTNVNLRAAGSAQSERVAVLNANEKVQVLQRETAQNNNEATVAQNLKISASDGKEYALNRGKAVVLQHYDPEHDQWFVTFSNEQEQYLNTWISSDQLSRTSNKDWFQVRRNDGSTGWVLGEFLTIR